MPRESRLLALRRSCLERFATVSALTVLATMAAGHAGVSTALAQSSVSRHVVAAGGGTASTSSLLVCATAGQPVAGSATAAGVTIWSGYWIPVAGAPIGLPPRDLPPPSCFALHPNRPNPFRGPTVIRVDVPAGGGEVCLEIFDLRGRRVATLLDEPATAGVQEIRWNGRDHRGVQLSAGLYLAVLRTPAGVLSRKLTLLR
jgi:hypothetical protein